jgi:copper chaperone CopZ
MFGIKKHDIEITVGGMSCMHCAKHVEEALNTIPGVKAEVDLKKNTAYADISTPVEDAALKAAVETAGYSATAIKRNR